MANDQLKMFRKRLEETQHNEPSDIGPLIDWLSEQRAKATFSAELISLSEVRNWQIQPQSGNVEHVSGEFFSVEGVRITSRAMREVNTWDQPIFNQKEGGKLVLLATEEDGIIWFLLAAKAEPGNVGTLQFAPTIQATWSNLKQAHKGKRPRFSEYLLGEAPATLIYQALHNEEGGRFWKKSNSNEIHFIEQAKTVLDVPNGQFIWTTLSQIKALCLVDNMVNPFVKTIIAPI